MIYLHAAVSKPFVWIQHAEKDVLWHSRWQTFWQDNVYYVNRGTRKELENISTNHGFDEKLRISTLCSYISYLLVYSFFISIFHLNSDGNSHAMHSLLVNKFNMLKSSDYFFHSLFCKSRYSFYLRHQYLNLFICKTHH